MAGTFTSTIITPTSGGGVGNAMNGLTTLANAEFSVTNIGAGQYLVVIATS